VFLISAKRLNQMQKRNDSALTFVFNQF